MDFKKNDMEVSGEIMKVTFTNLIRDGIVHMYPFLKVPTKSINQAWFSVSRFMIAIPLYKK